MPAENTEDFDEMPKNNLRIGRACVGDIFFSNIAEIPLICEFSDHFLNTIYDKKNRVLVAITEKGRVRKKKQYFIIFQKILLKL